MEEQKPNCYGTKEWSIGSIICYYCKNKKECKKEFMKKYEYKIK